MIKLKVDNSYTEIRGMSKECEMKIFEKLSFTVEEFNSPYLKIRHLYNRKTKKTYTGLLNQILEIFDERGEDYEIIDVRTKWKSNANFKLVDFIDKEKTIPLKIRPYQQEIINVCRDRDILCCATGAGKTFIMAGLIEKFNVKPVAVFADKIGLCEQLRDEFEKFLGVKVGLVGGGYNEKQDITVYSIQSAKEEDVEDAKMVMIDECHHIASNTFVSTLNLCKNAYYRIGVSATPWRDAGDELLLDAMLSNRRPEYDISASKLIDLGYLVPCNINIVPITGNIKGKNYQKVSVPRLL